MTIKKDLSMLGQSKTNQKRRLKHRNENSSFSHTMPSFIFPTRKLSKELRLRNAK